MLAPYPTAINRLFVGLVIFEFPDLPFMLFRLLEILQMNHK